ncbi:hypothetical protein WI80_03030 [Burkholderia ubonensis]|uniref:hypothetical protein n=1 Tax=Burkholderia TaxID=32008 RepID=UPI0005B6F275|nr:MULTISPECIES: hypothetical protein [Burkholderia]KIP16809.1 hypothetical protein KY49_5835 [Burkholderia sp. MSHR3999]KVA74927.1 hypothetical protein WM36_13155 [Burkholderia ubonensis]KVD15229.1 hypothetical protein WI79_28185 [Burkholderia ubonensis]KVD18438.1 hypothetical protein WI80_03030 [Burkholderia ubonensis]KVD29649.1 hypothetical protein WI83_19765 [Burkholderia ubonensis]
MKTISPIDKYRLQAARLQKTVKQALEDDSVALARHPVVQRLREHVGLSADNDALLRKRLHALPAGKYLDLLAREAGHDDWPALNRQLRAQQEADDDFAETELYKFNASEFNLNVWFPTYEDAREYLDTHRGFYLLQFKGSCFLAQAPHIIDIGLDPNDPDWDRIGRDWVKPKDPEAKQRLRDKLRLAREQAGKPAGN